MRILVIPDIHENLAFLKYIFAVEATESFDIWPDSWLGESMLDSVS
jgi:hypothetical protein